MNTNLRVLITTAAVAMIVGFAASASAATVRQGNRATTQIEVQSNAPLAAYGSESPRDPHNDR